MKFLHHFFKTKDSIYALILRITVGFVILAHGVQKLFGWFGGHGASETMETFNKWFGLPYPVTFLVILSDSIGAFLLILGLCTRFVTVTIAMVMLGAIFIVHGRWGFYMNWYAEPRGEGIEFHILVLGIMMVLFLIGGGKYSIDNLIYKKIQK